MADTTTSVEQLYVAYFSRPADPAGLAFWKNVMNTDPNALDKITAAFSQTDEYKLTYAGMDNTAVVNAVYHNLFGRAGEKAGVDFWVNALNNHYVTIDTVVKAFADGALNNDRVAFNGRTAVAASFTAHLDQQAEIDAFNSVQGMLKAKAFIGTIVDLQTAATAIDPGVIDAKIAEIVGTPSGHDLPHFPV